MSKQFAPGYEKDENGWYLFPRDVKWRRELFPKEVFNHPAKNNLYLTQELVRYLTEPGDSIIDPFAGTGSLMLALYEKRKVVLIELEPHYVELINKAWGGLDQSRLEPGRPGMHLFEGDCRLVLQKLDFLCDASIFSPPFSTSITRGKPLPTHEESISQFVVSPLNLGALNPFLYAQALKKIFDRLSQRLVPHAPVAIISRDMIRGARRVLLSEDTIRAASKAGLDLQDWFKWKPPGSAQRRIQESRGARVVEDEDILCFRKRH